MKRWLFIIALLLLLACFTYVYISKKEVVKTQVLKDVVVTSSSSIAAVAQSSSAAKNVLTHTGLIQLDTISFNSYLLSIPDGWLIDEEKTVQLNNGACEPDTKGEGCTYRDIIKDNITVRLFDAKNYPPVSSSFTTELFTVSHPAFSVPFTFSYNQDVLTGVEGCYNKKLCIRVDGRYNKKDADEIKKLLNSMVN